MNALRKVLFWVFFSITWMLLACKAPQLLAERLGGAPPTPMRTIAQEGSAYPQGETTEELDAYPSFGGNIEVPSTTSVDQYPAGSQEGLPQEMPSPTFTEKFVSTDASSVYPIETTSESSYPGAVLTTSAPSFGNQYPEAGTATPTMILTITQGAASTSTSATSTHMPTVTPSPTPTATRTPVPPPPWLSSELYASDPRSFRLDSGRVQLVMFFAFWSGVSQAMAPIVHGVEAMYKDRMNFVYLDIDDPATLPFQKALNFHTPPHFFLLDAQGRVLKSWLGYVTADELIAFIEGVLD